MAELKKFIIGEEAWFYKKSRFFRGLTSHEAIEGDISSSGISTFSDVKIIGKLLDKYNSYGNQFDSLISDGQGGWYWDVGGIRVYRQSTPPTSARVGDFWIDDTDGTQYLNFDDGNSIQWVEFGPTPRAQLLNGIYVDSETLGGQLPSYYLDYNNFTNTPNIITGTGSPEGVIDAPVGSMFLRSDGDVGTTLYVKEIGTGNTGWSAK
jgi:hypothetical protein